MNKTLKTIIIALVVVIVTGGVFYVVKNQMDPGKEEEVKVNPVQNYKNYDAYVEETINSFFQTYSNMVNSKSIDMSYLSDIVDKNSAAYKVIESEINELRKNSVQLQIAITEINIIQKADNLYNAKVTIDKIITSGAANENPISKLEITVRAQEGYKITEYKKQ